MKVTLLGEDDMHLAVLRGLVARWCPDAITLNGEFRGSQRGSRRKELLSILERAFVCNDSDCALILLDADNDTWHAKAANERQKVPESRREHVAVGSPERNIECWLVADREAFCRFTDSSLAELAAACEVDPKPFVKSALNRARGDSNLYDLVASFSQNEVRPVSLQKSPSFKGFFEECRTLGRLVCGRVLPTDPDASNG